MILSNSTSRKKPKFLFSVIAKSDVSGNIHLADLINDLRKELKKGHCDALFEKKLEDYGGTGEGYFPELEPAYRRTKKYLHDPNDDCFFESSQMMIIGYQKSRR